MLHKIHINQAVARKIALYFLVSLLLSTFNFQLSTAQKFPERRTVRQGTKLYGKGDYTGAEERYRQAIEMDPELREAGFNLGGTLWRQAVESAKNQDVAQGTEPGSEQKAGQQKLQQAADAWTAIAADSLTPAPMVSAASYNVGNVALAGQQIDAAIEAYKQSLRLRPDDMEAKFNLAYAQKLKQQQEQNQNQNDQNGGQNDQNDDQNSSENDNNGQNQEGDGQNDQNDDTNNPDNDNNEREDPGDGGAKIDPRTVEQMLDAMQAAEDDTREKVNAKEVQVGARSGKNW